MLPSSQFRSIALASIYAADSHSSTTAIYIDTSKQTTDNYHAINLYRDIPNKCAIFIVNVGHLSFLERTITLTSQLFNSHLHMLLKSFADQDTVLSNVYCTSLSFRQKV